MKLLYNENLRGKAIKRNKWCFEPFIANVGCGYCSCVQAVNPCTPNGNYYTPYSN